MTVMDLSRAGSELSDAEPVWQAGPSEKVVFRFRHLLVMLYLLAPMGLTATLGTISFASADGDTIASFWPAAAFQVVFSIWFGVYGAAAGVLGPMLGNGLVGASPILFVVANTIQSCTAGLWFRYRRLDPRLRRRRDWVELIVVGCVISSAVGGLAAATESWLRHAAAEEQRDLSFYLFEFRRWVLADIFPSLLLAPAMLKSISPMIVRGPFFCERFWGPAGRGRQWQIRWFRLGDIPMAGKLMILVLVAGMLPLYVVAGWEVWNSLIAASRTAMEVNQDIAWDSRDEIERHELLLRLWATEYDRLAGHEEERIKRLSQWQSQPDTFDHLEIADRASIERRLSRHRVPWLQREGVAFFAVPSPGGPRRRLGRQGRRICGVAALQSRPDRVLTGLMNWRERGAPIGGLQTLRAFIVVDPEGREVYRQLPRAFSNWQPPKESFDGKPRVIEVAGRRWHVAEADINRFGVRFFAITSAREGMQAVLANVPNPVAVLLNLAIFGSLIVGSEMARRLAGRVLEIARCVQDAGPAPGRLRVPERGHDELGYLAQALNRMSQDLAAYVRELQVTTAEKERLAREMELAREVQQSVLPQSPPQVNGYEVAALCLPAYEVGGDFYDIFVARDGQLNLMIGDAAGKGLGAAMFMTEARAIARVAALDGLMPDQVLRAANRALLSKPNKPGNFATVFCALLESDKHRLHYASAGHIPPVLVRGDRIVPLEIGGFPLAVMKDGDYQPYSLDLAPGDCLVMYTDGVTEATSPDHQQFQTDRLNAVLRVDRVASARATIETIVAAVQEFVGGTPQSDDMTLLVIRRLP
jgi:serine phosphatase RsbU (regulator of sigma subunit)